VFGGQVLAWIDICAATAAQRHCRSVVVTASFDAVEHGLRIHGHESSDLARQVLMPISGRATESRLSAKKACPRGRYVTA
jgi:hypothetical protein